MWNLFKKSPAEEESLKLNQIQAQLEEAKKDLDSTNAIIKDNLCTLAIQEKTIKANKDTITSQEEILRGYGILEDIGYQFENTPPLSEAEQNLAEAEEQMAAITGSDNIIIYTRTYRIDGSERKGQKFQEAYGKNLLTGFNAYALSKEKGKPNYAYASELIKKSFEKFNKQGELVGIMLNPEFLTARLAVLHAKCQVRQAKAEEAAKMREYKRKLREEAKVHQYFDQKRVNAFNRHKEFFNVTPAEAVYVLTNKFNCKVTFVDETLEDQEEMINDADE